MVVLAAIVCTGASAAAVVALARSLSWLSMVITSLWWTVVWSGYALRTLVVMDWMWLVSCFLGVLGLGASRGPAAKAALWPVLQIVVGWQGGGCSEGGGGLLWLLCWLLRSRRGGDRL